MAFCGKKRQGKCCFGRKKVKFFDLDEIVEQHLKEEVNYGSSTNGKKSKVHFQRYSFILTFWLENLSLKNCVFTKYVSYKKTF